MKRPIPSLGARRRFTIAGHAMDAPALDPGLYVVATPIGNLGDITLRALATLAAVDTVACEDTRQTARLLDRYAIDARRVAYNEHNADRAGPGLLDAVADGAAVALVSDAGTPLVSDPGQRLVAQAVDRGLPVVALPGASAPLAALVASGLASTPFTFAGFAPNRRGALAAWAKAHADRPETLVAFEAPTRIAATLAVLAREMGDGRRAVVARELTKMHETLHRGTLRGLADAMGAMERVRGEIVLVIEGADRAARMWDDAAVDAALLEALATMGTRDASAQVAAASGRAKRELYRRALDLAPDDATGRARNGRDGERP